jgi:streptogramin lyase
MTSNIVVGSWPSKDGTLWFGSYNGGLTHCIPSAPGEATVVNYQASQDGQGLANNSVWALTEDKWGRMWFSTLGGGLQVLDPKTHQYRTWSTKNSQIPGDYLTSVAWNKKGWLMVGSGNFYSLVNPVSGKLMNQEIPESEAITVNINTTNYVIEDSRGIIWHGSSSGLTVYDPKTKFITLLDMTDGLFGSSINSIIEDKKYNIWAVTDHGVTNIVPIKQEDGTWQFNIRSYNSRDGLQKAVYNQRSTFLTRDGKVLIGGQGGLDIIDPSKLEDVRQKEHPVFSGLQIFDQDIAVGQEFDGRVILDEALDVCRELSLKFNDQFTIQLATNEVSVNNSKRFAYKVVGFNENWVKTSELNPNITFNSLRAGEYTLCVRILKEDGSLGEDESRLEITIRPPLYRTRWMVALYMIAIAGIAFLWRRRFLRKHKEQMELVQLQRETEKKQWMSEMRKQMEEEMRLFMTKESKVYVADENGVIEPEEVEEVINKQKLDLVPLFRMACDAFRTPEGKEINVLFFPFVDNLDVMGDRKQLGEMLTILLNNAANFSPSKSKIKVFLEKKGDNAELRVADSGIGIPSEAMATLFDEIIGDDDNLNLHKVFDIVLAHKGTIRAEENQGGGTVFVIEIPTGLEIPVEDAVIMDDDEDSKHKK